MKKILVLILAFITIFTILLGINVFGDNFVDTETGLKVQSTNENVLDDWNKVVLRADNGNFITIQDNNYTGFPLESVYINKINYHILKGDKVFFRFYIKYWEEIDGFQTYSFSINNSTNFSTNGYDEKSSDGLEYYRGDEATTVGAFYIDNTITDGEIQYQLNDEKIYEKVNGYEYSDDAVESLRIELSAKGQDYDTWHLQYLELQYRIVDESIPEITSANIYNPDTLEYNLEVNEHIIEYSIDNGLNWISLDIPAKSTSLTLNKGLNEIKVKDQAGNISNANSFYANTIEIVNTFDAYSKLYDGKDYVDVYNDSTTIIGVHTGHDVSLDKHFSFLNFDAGNNKEVNLEKSSLIGADSDKYILRFDTAPTAIADIYDKLSWSFIENLSNDQNDENYDFTSVNGAQRDQYEGRNSVKFVRENSQYLITDNDNRLLPTGSDLTYSSWYYLNEPIVNADRYFIIESSGDNHPLSYGLKNEDLNDNQTSKGQVFTDSGSFYLDNSSGSCGANTGEWYNITVTYDDSEKTHTAYLNGVKSGNLTDIAVGYDIEKIILGSFRGENGRFWDGYIDNLSIWGRVLSESEINDLQDYNMYTISYDGNGSTSGSLPEDKIYEGGTTYDIPSDSYGLLREGYVFTGWNTKADGTGDSINFTVEKDTTLYAQWDYIGEFKVSDYGTGQDSTYRWYRGYLFKVNQETTVTSLIGGGNGGVFAGAIYSVDGFTVNPDDSINGNINPTAVLGSVEFTGTDPNQIVKLDSELTLQANTYYLIASGRQSWEGLNEKEDPNYGYGYVVKNIDVNNLESDSTVINSWLPKSTGTTNTAIQYEHFDVNPTTIFNKTHRITEDLPMIGFQYTTNVNPPEVETNIADVTTSGAVLKGNLTSTGDGESGVYFEIGTTENLSSDGTLYKVNSLSSPSNYSYTINSLTENKYYYRAVAVNEAGRSQGSIKYFNKPYNISYHLNGGTNNSSNPDVTAATDEDITLFDPAKTGYKFIGWYDSETGGNKVTHISSETSAINLYARWNLAPVAGFIEPSGDSYKRGDTVTLEWVASSDVEGVEIKYDVDYFTTDTDYIDIDDTLTGTSINFELPSEGAKQINFRVRAYDGEKYSEFTESDYIKIYYEVTFKDYDDSLITTKSGIEITPPNPTRIGYTFTGWDGSYINLLNDKTITAVYIPNENTEYTLNHYIESLDGNYELKETENLTGTTNTTETAIARDYTGFSENTTHDDRKESGNIAGDGSLTLKLFYDREVYTVTFKDHDGTGLKTQSVKYEGNATAPTDPVREGYTFDGWDKTFTSITGNLTVNATYNINSYNLTVNYKMADGSTAPVSHTESIDYNTAYSVASPNVDGYTADTFSVSGIMGANDITETVEYSTNQYTITFDTKDGSSISPLTQNYNTEITPPENPTKPGYYLGGWNPSLPLTMPAEDVTVVAQWIPEGETKYEVEHYQQNINDDGYTLIDTEIKYGKTESKVTSSAIEYNGLYYDEDNESKTNSGDIIGDGSLTLKLYYNREEYTVTFLNHEDETLKTESVRYEGSATPPPRPGRSGYDFKEWNEDYTYVTSDVVTKATYRKEEPEPVVQKSIVIVNGEEQSSGTETSLEVDGKMTVTYSGDSEKIEEKINQVLQDNQENTEQNILEIPIQTTNPDIVKSKLTGDIVKKLEDENFNINIKTEISDYEIAAEEMTITNVAKELGVEESSLEKIEIDIEINKASGSEERQVVVKGREEGYRVLITPVEFKVTARTTSSNGEEKEVEIKEFKNYVKRTLPLPEDIDPNKITTAVLIEKDGKVVHIPTQVFQTNGKWYAKINSLTNSQYTLINNEKEVKGAENHWAKEAVEDLASRKVIEETKYFLPDASISRGEFAEYITKALGIYRTEIAENVIFTDVKAKDEHSVAIRAAVKYGIINGYPDGSFRPENKITREEAMVMYSRAIKIAKIEEIDLENIQNYKDKEKVSHWAIEEVKKTIGSGVFYGRTSETVDPEADFTFAEAATAVRNLLIKAELINK